MRTARRMTIYHQFLFSVAALNLSIILLTSSVLYYEKRSALLSGIDNRLASVATLAREILPADYHDRIVGPDSVSAAEFDKIVDRNNRLCVELGLEYIWSLLLVDGKIVFTTATSPDKVVANQKHAKFFELHSNPELYVPTFETMRPTYQSSFDKWGAIRVVLLPYRDAHGRKYLFGASVRLTDVRRQLRAIVWQSVAVGGGAFALCMILGFVVAHVVTAPFHRLTETIRLIAAGNAELLADESGTYEQATLANAVNNLNRVLQEKIAALTASEARLIDQRNSEREQAREDMVLSEQRYRNLMNFAADGILVGSRDGVITDANEYMCLLFDRPSQEIIGRHVCEMPFTPESVREYPYRFDLVYSGEIVVRERSIRRKDGSELVVEVRSKMMSDGTLQSIYRDVTERNKSQKLLLSWNVELERRVVERTEEVAQYSRRLRELTDRLVRAEEEECQRISDVLHEDLQQVLVAARMTLDVVRQGLQDPVAQKSLTYVDDMLTRSLLLTRTLVQEIAVPAVHEGDLVYAVKSIAHRMQEKFGLNVGLTADENLEPLGKSVYICLYRVIQELLFNVVKHAGVKEVSIEIGACGRDFVQIVVCDRGGGFDFDGLANSSRGAKGFGLFSIRERIEGLGGQLKVVSALGAGTTVIVVVPMGNA